MHFNPFAEPSNVIVEGEEMDGGGTSERRGRTTILVPFPRSSKVNVQQKLINAVGPLPDNFWDELKKDAPEWWKSYSVGTEPVILRKLDELIRNRNPQLAQRMAASPGPPSRKKRDRTEDRTAKVTSKRVKSSEADKPYQRKFPKLDEPLYYSKNTGHGWTDGESSKNMTPECAPEPIEAGISANVSSVSANYPNTTDEADDQGTQENHVNCDDPHSSHGAIPTETIKTGHREYSLSPGLGQTSLQEIQENSPVEVEQQPQNTGATVNASNTPDPNNIASASSDHLCNSDASGIITKDQTSAPEINQNPALIVTDPHGGVTQGLLGDSDIANTERSLTEDREERSGARDQKGLAGSKAALSGLRELSAQEIDMQPPGPSTASNVYGSQSSRHQKANLTTFSDNMRERQAAFGNISLITHDLIVKRQVSQHKAELSEKDKEIGRLEQKLQDLREKLEAQKHDFEKTK